MADNELTQKEFTELIAKTNMENPKEDDILALRKAMERSPKIWNNYYDLAHLVADDLIKEMPMSPTIEEGLKVGWHELRRSLGSEEASTLECLLIDQVVLCWLRLHWAEGRLTHSRVSSSLMGKNAFAEKQLTAAQGRFLRASETLARVRKIIQRTPALQVNIATNGGQQINISKSD